MTFDRLTELIEERRMVEEELLYCDESDSKKLKALVNRKMRIISEHTKILQDKKD